jgi:hypothetical protein
MTNRARKRPRRVLCPAMTILTLRLGKRRGGTEMTGTPASDGGRDYDKDHDDSPDEAPPQSYPEPVRPDNEGGHGGSDPKP